MLCIRGQKVAKSSFYLEGMFFKSPKVAQTFGTTFVRKFELKAYWNSPILSHWLSSSLLLLFLMIKVFVCWCPSRFMSVRSFSVTCFVNFWKILATKFITKVTQILSDFRAIYKIITPWVIADIATFWPLFADYWDTF